MPQNWLSGRNRARREGSLGGKRSPQPGLVDAELGVAAAINSHHWNRLEVPGSKAGIVLDVPHYPVDTKVATDSADHLQCVITKVAAGLRDQLDPRHITTLPRLLTRRNCRFRSDRFFPLTLEP